MTPDDQCCELHKLAIQPQAITIQISAADAKRLRAITGIFGGGRLLVPTRLCAGEA